MKRKKVQEKKLKEQMGIKNERGSIIRNRPTVMEIKHKKKSRVRKEGKDICRSYERGTY